MLLSLFGCTTTFSLPEEYKKYPITRYAFKEGVVNGQEQVAPRIVEFIQPNVPQELLEKNDGGHVNIVGVIEKDGRIRLIEKVESSNPEIESYAISALRESIFLPALLDGKPIRLRIEQSYRLRIDL